MSCIFTSGFCVDKDFSIVQCLAKPHSSLRFLALMPDSLDLRLHRHGRKRQSGHTQSGLNRPVARYAVLQRLDKELPLVVDVELVATEKVDL